MKIELIICVLETVDDELTLNDLANLTTTTKIDYVDDSVEFVFRIVSSREELLQVVKDHLCDTRGANCVVISDQLLNSDAENLTPEPSSTAETIFKFVRDNVSACGLIALTKTKTNHVPGIDAIVISGRKARNELRKELKTITGRLWYKRPPNNSFQHSGGELFSVEIAAVSDKRNLLQSFELRGKVYSALGYIEKSSIEMDAYDLTSIPFLALDRANQDRVVGAMRVIIPGRGPLNMAVQRYSFDHYGDWAREMAKDNVDRQWWKAIMKRAPTALPVLNAFKYFQVPDEEMEIDGMVMPRNVCELSRVVVAPEYRGMGVSKLLVNHAISVAKKMRRQYLWIECAPHHIKMYKKYGFVVKHHQNQVFYERAQRLDTWAVAMYLDLEAIQCQTKATSANAICYRMQIAEERGGNSLLLFQFSQHKAEEIEQVFDSPINPNHLPSFAGVRGVSMPLKKLILSTLSCHDTENFIICLKALVSRVKVERLSLQNSNGRTFCFNPHNLNSGKRQTIESGLLQWCR